MRLSAAGGVALALLVVSSAFAAPEVRGNVAGEIRWFPQGALGGQANQSFSVSSEVELHQSIGASSLTFTPFVRLDSEDERRTHFDVRELYGEWYGDAWELRLGFNRVFWGVTEVQHLVDIVNQTDLVENIDAEDKLGQLMLNLSLIRGFGTLDAFVMTAFRERTFPGPHGRVRFALVVDEDNVTYESRHGHWHPDWAVRWSHYVGPLDFGIAWFSGTSRDPMLSPHVESGVAPVLRQHYPLIDQLGLDTQLTLGGWLWKLEAYERRGFGPRYAAAIGGFEYTVVGVAGTPLDLGLLSEYSWDERGDEATTPFQNDLFAGARLAFNDVQSTSLLTGVIRDLDGGGFSFLLEGTRRVGSSWSVSLESRAFGGLSLGDFLYPIRNDSHFQLDLARYF